MKKDLISTNEIYYRVSERFEELRAMNLESIEAIEDSEESRRLNHRQRQFVNEYCSTFNASNAVVKAGFSSKSPANTADRLLNDKAIQAAIIRRLNAMSFLSALTRETVVLELYEIYQNLRDDPKQDYGLQLKALEIIARLQNYYSPQIAITNQSHVIDGVKIHIINTPQNGEDGQQL